jgi:hypothetical protein
VGRNLDTLTGVDHPDERALGGITVAWHETSKEVVKSQSDSIACLADELLRRRIQQENTIVVI